MISKVVISLGSVMVGWIAGFLYYAIYMTFLSVWGRPTDVEAILFWSGTFVFIAWLLAVLPFILLVGEDSRFLQFPLIIAIGAIGGLLGFLMLVGWWTGFWREALYLVYGAVVGAATGAAYAGLRRLRLRWVKS